MSSDGGSGRGADDTTSFVLQPPNAQPGPPNPYAVPTQAAATSHPADPGAGRLIAGRYRLLA